MLTISIVMDTFRSVKRSGKPAAKGVNQNAGKTDSMIRIVPKVCVIIIK